MVPVRPEVVRRLAAPALPLVTELFWLRTVNAVGAAQSESEHRALYDLGRFVTELDPRLEGAYWFVAIVLPFQKSRNQWLFGDLSNDLITRGLEAFPTNLKLKLLRAYNTYFYLHRPAEAGHLFSEAARDPAAPPYVGLLATRLLGEGGDVDQGLLVAQTLLESAESDEERAAFKFRIRQLQTERVLQRIDAALARFRVAKGREPLSLYEVVSEGLLSPDALEDPSGGHLYVDGEGNAQSDAYLDRLRAYKAGEQVPGAAPGLDEDHDD